MTNIEIYFDWAHHGVANWVVTNFGFWFDIWVKIGLHQCQWNKNSDIQSSAVITRCNTVRHYINSYRNCKNINQMLNQQQTPLTGELWGVFCEYSWENWPRYKGTTLYSNESHEYIKDDSDINKNNTKQENHFHFAISLYILHVQDKYKRNSR